MGVMKKMPRHGYDGRASAVKKDGCEAEVEENFVLFGRQDLQGREGAVCAPQTKQKIQHCEKWCLVLRRKPRW
jgi:hypothetical protein